MADYKKKRNNKRSFDRTKNGKFDKGDKYETGSNNTKHDNDAKWYTSNAQRVLDAGRLSFNIPTGSPVDLKWRSEITTINGLTKSQTKFPGVCALDFLPTYGKATVPDDPLTIASRIIYGKVRDKNSGSKNYDPNDLMIYLMAMDNAYIWYQFLCRIYGVAHVYDGLNRHVPGTLLEAMNVDWDDLRPNMANFRAYINTVAAKIGSYYVPNTFPLYLRHMWMCSGIYADSPTPKAQFYMFVPREIGVYDETGHPAGGAIKPYGLDFTQKFTVNYLERVMDSIISAITTSQDCGVISGDILKAYDGNLFTVSQISDDYTVVPVYSEEVLRQIENATIIDYLPVNPSFTYDDGYMIHQDIGTASFLQSDLNMQVGTYGYEGNRILTGSDGTPSPEEVLVNSRLTVTGKVLTDHDGDASTLATLTFAPTAMGTEVIVQAWIFGLDDYNPGIPEAFNKGFAYMSPYGTMSTSNLSQMSRYQNVLWKADMFNYHPRFGYSYPTIDSTGVPTSEVVYQLQDVDNYTIVDDTVMYNLHNAVLLSLFGVD